MVIWLLFWLIILVMLFVLWRVISHTPTNMVTRSEEFFLKDRIFASLLLYTNFWLVLLLLVGLYDLFDNNKPSILIMVSLFAPFLSFWQKRRRGEDQ